MDNPLLNFILALVGALSWIPIIYDSILKKFSKTRIIIYPDQLMSIAENEYNVIINLRIGLHTKVKDAFIENMSLVVKHSDGEKRHFKWAQLIENISQTTINDNVMPTSKILNAIGYKLSKETYTEVFISFINPEFRTRYEDLSNQLRIKSYYITKNKYDKKQMEISEPYIEMCNNYKKHFTWAEGDYSGELTVNIGDQQFSKSFSFYIDQPHSETFAGLNIDMVIDKLKNNFIREASEKLTYDDKMLDTGIPLKLTVH